MDRTHPLPDNPAILTAMVARRTHTYFDRALRPHGIGFSQFRMLGFLYRAGDRPVMQEDIRAHMDLDKGSIAHTIRRLVDEGFVTREPHPEDGRAYEIRLTQKSHDFRAEWERIADHWSELLVEDLDAEERAVLSKLLKHLIDNACAELDANCDGDRT
jgi:DNA-binding MarR family transcriptional regulator